MYGDNCNGRTSCKYAVKFDRNWEGLHDAECDLLAIAKFIVLLGSVITISHEPCSRHTVNNSYTQGVPRSCRVMENDYKVVEFSITVCTNYSNWQTVISNQWFTQYALNRGQHWQWLLTNSWFSVADIADCQWLTVRTIRNCRRLSADSFCICVIFGHGKSMLKKKGHPVYLHRTRGAPRRMIVVRTSYIQNTCIPSAIWQFLFTTTTKTIFLHDITLHNKPASLHSAI